MVVQLGMGIHMYIFRGLRSGELSTGGMGVCKSDLSHADLREIHRLPRICYMVRNPESRNLGMAYVHRYANPMYADRWIHDSFVKKNDG
jgi:hypothetical protein